MEVEKDNVVLFPAWKKELETKSLQLLQAMQYKEALPMLEKLLDYEANNHEIIVGKIVCLIELDRADEAEDLCETLLANEDEHYYQYMHLYVTILFQTHQYQYLMDRISYELKDNQVPVEIAEQLKEFSMMGEQMLQDELREQTAENMAVFLKEITGKNYTKQWQLIENLRKMKATSPASITNYLIDETVHPVIKTVIFKWLRDQEISEPVNIYKLDAQVKISPKQMLEIRKHQVFKQVLHLLSELEHQNPSLFILLEQLLYRYLYICYPIMPQVEEGTAIASALESIGDTFLHKDEEAALPKEVEKYIDEINFCGTLYVSVIEE